LKRETSTAARSLRAVGLTITLVTIVTFAALGYSAYQDVQGVFSAFGGSTSHPAVTGRTVYQQGGAVLHLNVTLRNNGLFPLALSLSCANGTGTAISCSSSSANIAPGETKTLHFSMTVANVTQSTTSNVHVQGVFSAGLEPFVSISASVDLGSFLGGG